MKEATENERKKERKERNKGRWNKGTYE